ncbi:MAG: hypothetical protein KatS3mg096_480 [Candidatus Parcubacteria bacterium]|nr:MAG: hypothetical protein KatS3mg096_480 [Candidatus Parcubacteria bacterium]
MLRRFLIILIVFIILEGSNVFAQTCPAQTTYGNTWATLVGEIQDNGGDPNITAWFEWGTSSFSLTNRTPDQFLFIPNPPQGFCQTITGLQPCTTYFYRAASRNSGGTNYGNIYSFRTNCVFSNLQVSCSASPNPANVNQTVVFTANVSGGNGSYSYSWSGACSGSSSTCSRSFSSAGTYTANITVTSGNETKSASCSVNISSGQNSSIINQLPIAVIAFTPEDIRPGTIVTFDASQSYDPDGFIISYEWIINNETVSNLKTFNRALASGAYRVKLIVTDNQGSQSSKEILISVGRTTYLTRTVTRTVTRSIEVPTPIQKTNNNKLIDLLVEPTYSVNVCAQNTIQLTLINNTSVNRKITIKANGEVGNWFKPSERDFVLEPNSSRLVDWIVDVPCSGVVKTKNYNIDFKVSTPGANYSFSSDLQIKGINTSLLGFIGAFGGVNIFWLFLLFLIIFLLAFLWYRFRELEKRYKQNLR